MKRPLTGVIVLLYIFFVPTIYATESGGGRFRFLSSIFKNIIQHKIFQRKTSSTSSTTTSSSTSASYVDELNNYLNFALEENTILRDELANYKKIISSQKRSYQTVKSELLHLQFKLESIEQLHKKEIDSLKQELILRFQKDKQLYETSLIKEYEVKSHQLIKQLNQMKTEEINAIKQELLNEIKSIKEQENKEKEKLKQLLIEEKSNTKELKSTFDKNTQALKQQHKLEIDEIKKSLKSAAATPSTANVASPQTASPVISKQKSDTQSADSEVVNDSSSNSKTKTSTSTGNKPKTSKLPRRIPSSNSNTSSSSSGSSKRSK